MNSSKTPSKTTITSDESELLLAPLLESSDPVVVGEFLAIHEEFIRRVKAYNSKANTEKRPELTIVDLVSLDLKKEFLRNTLPSSFPSLQVFYPVSRKFKSKSLDNPEIKILDRKSYERIISRLEYLRVEVLNALSEELRVLDRTAPSNSSAQPENSSAAVPAHNSDVVDLQSKMLSIQNTSNLSSFLNGENKILLEYTGLTRDDILARGP